MYIGVLHSNQLHSTERLSGDIYPKKILLNAERERDNLFYTQNITIIGGSEKRLQQTNNLCPWAGIQLMTLAHTELIYLKLYMAVNGMI